MKNIISKKIGFSAAIVFGLGYGFMTVANNSDQLLTLSSGSGKTFLAESLIDVFGASVSYNGEAAMRAAAGAGHSDTLKMLIENGSDVAGFHGHDAVYTAAMRCHSGALSVLVENGAALDNIDLYERLLRGASSQCGVGSETASILEVHVADFDNYM